MLQSLCAVLRAELANRSEVLDCLVTVFGGIESAVGRQAHWTHIRKVRAPRDKLRTLMAAQVLIEIGIASDKIAELNEIVEGVS